MPISWDAKMDRKLFLAILKVHDISVDAEAVARELNMDEQPCTTVAIRKRLAKIKTQIKEGAVTTTDGATPRKRVAGKADGETPAKKGKKSSGKGEKMPIAAEEDEKDDEESSETKTKVKKEDVDEEEP